MKHKYKFGYSRKFAEKWDAMKKRRGGILPCGHNTGYLVICNGTPSYCGKCEDERIKKRCGKQIITIGGIEYDEEKTGGFLIGIGVSSKEVQEQADEAISMLGDLKATFNFKI